MEQVVELRVPHHAATRRRGDPKDRGTVDEIERCKTGMGRGIGTCGFSTSRVLQLI